MEKDPGNPELVRRGKHTSAKGTVYLNENISKKDIGDYMLGGKGDNNSKHRAASGGYGHRARASGAVRVAGVTAITYWNQMMNINNTSNKMFGKHLGQ